MLRALSPGILTVHGKRRAFNLVVSRCIQQSRPLVDVVRNMKTVGTAGPLHKDDQVRVQVVIAPNDARTVKNPHVFINTSLSKTLHSCENLQEEQNVASEDGVAAPTFKANYLRQRALENRMHARVRIVASHANDRKPTKRFQRFAQLVQPYVQERNENKKPGSPKRAVEWVDPADPVLANLYNTLRKSEDINELWDTYQALLLFDSSSASTLSRSTADSHAPSETVPTSSSLTNAQLPTTSLPLSSSQSIPLKLLRRLARIFASAQPRTRTLFLRLLSVLSALAARDVDVPLWAWNALIDCAGKGWRRKSLTEYRTALSVYNDMIANGRGQGDVALNEKEGAVDRNGNGNENENGAAAGTQYGIEEKENAMNPAEPDIVTLTTLFEIAVETRNEAAIRHASSLLQSSGLTPTEVTHLVRLKDRRQVRGLIAVRYICRSLDIGRRSELNIVALNAMLWTIGQDGRWDILTAIYRVLQQNVESQRHDAGNADDRKDSKTVVEGIPVPHSLIPNVITYTTLIQCLSYNGQLLRALEVFRDMLYRAEASGDHTLQPSLAIFRALFCAFARHTTTSNKPNTSSSNSIFRSDDEWTEENLDMLFKHFLQLPVEAVPNERTIYWILSSYVRLCGERSPKVSDIFRQLSERVDIKSTGRLGYLKATYGRSEVPTGAHETSPR